MVNTKWIAISYVCIFFFVYLSWVAYAFVPNVLNKIMPNNTIVNNLPTSNATMSITMASSSVNVFAGFGLIGVAIIIMAAFGYISMFRGME